MKKKPELKLKKSNEDLMVSKLTDELTKHMQGLLIGIEEKNPDKMLASFVPAMTSFLHGLNQISALRETK